MSTFNEVVKALKDNGVEFSLGLSGYDVNHDLSEVMTRITVRHANNIEACLDFEPDGEWFHRVIRKNRKDMYSNTGTENSLYGAYWSLVDPAKDLTTRINMLKEHMIGKNPARYELDQLKINSYQSILDRL